MSKPLSRIREISKAVVSAIPVDPSCITRAELMKKLKGYGDIRLAIFQFPVQLPVAEDGEGQETRYCFLSELDKRAAISYYNR